MLQLAIMIELKLPYPPSVNHYWGVAGKRRFVGSKGQAFRQAVLEAAQGAQKMDGRLAMLVELNPPDRRVRDIDNVTKALLDACMKAGCYEDDSQIDDLRIVRKEIIKGGACKVTISFLSPPHTAD